VHDRLLMPLLPANAPAGTASPASSVQVIDQAVATYIRNTHIKAA